MPPLLAARPLARPLAPARRVPTARWARPAAATGANGAPPPNGASDEPDAPRPSTARAFDGVRSYKLELNEEQREMISDLADRDQFGRRGEALVAAQLAALFFVVFPPYAVTLAVQLVGVACLFGGLALAAAGVGGIGTASLTPFPAPRKSNRLATGGAYSLVRHPMYGGLTLASFGLAAASASPGRVAAAGALLYVLLSKIRVEETALAELHGDEWRQYAAAVPRRLVPWLW